MSFQFASAAIYSIEVPPLQNRILFIPLKVGENLNIHYTSTGGSLYVIIEDGNGNVISKYDNLQDISVSITPFGMDGDYKVILENTSLNNVAVTLEYQLIPDDPNRVFATNPTGTFATIMSWILLIIIGLLAIGLAAVFAYERFRMRNGVLNEA